MTLPYCLTYSFALASACLCEALNSRGPQRTKSRRKLPGTISMKPESLINKGSWNYFEGT
jgi:hypothetical protein